MPSDEHPLSKRYPELQRFDSRNDAQEILGRFDLGLMKRPRVWLALLAFVIGGGVLFTLVMVWLG